jgi:hypothetical protein
MNIVYGAVADHLTDRENHRTDTEYEDSLIAKLFMFVFANSYASFIYIAFVQRYLEEGATDPMNSLSLNLCVIFGSKLVVGNIVETLLPRLVAQQRLKQETKGTDAGLTQPELEYILLPYDIIKGPIRDYAELALQFGYLTLFVTAFPAAPFLALISNVIEIHVDSSKLISTLQRPVPGTAENIGTWQTIFEIVSVLSVISNSALVCFTMTVFEKEPPLTRVWLFICFQYFTLSIMYVFTLIVPDEPEVRIVLALDLASLTTLQEVAIQLQRQHFWVRLQSPVTPSTLTVTHRSRRSSTRFQTTMIQLCWKC